MAALRARAPRVLLSVLGALALVGAGCGGSGAKSPDSRASALKVKNPFPTKGALEKLAKSAPKAVPARDVVSVPDWRVDVRDLPDSSPVEKRYAALGSNFQLTRELRCVAREYSRFRAQHGADPDERVQRFVSGACGLASGVGLASAYSSAEVPVEITDEQLLDHWQSKLTLPPSFKGKQAGVWLTRNGKKAVVVAVARDDKAPPVSLASTDVPGKVTIRGTVGPDAEQVLALVNQGTDGVAHCEADRSVVLPEYAFTCMMAEGDPWTWIEIASRSSGRLLMRTTALLLARREQGAAVELAKGAASAAAGVGAQERDAARTVLEGVNRARQNGKLAPLALAPKQSGVNGQLAPHFFNAEATNDASTGDLVALGLMAGYDVEGTIKNGGLFGTMLTGAKDASSWLDYALEHPLGRFVLFRPDARQAAIGTTSVDGKGIGVVVTTYSFFGAEDHQADSAHVLERLSQERAARHLAPVTPMPDMPSLVEGARLVNAGQREPMAALDTALGAETQRLGQRLQGWVLVTNDLDVLPFPKELLAPAPLPVRVVVTHYRPEDAPWGTYLIYFVSPAPAQQQVAAMPASVAAAQPLPKL